MADTTVRPGLDQLTAKQREVIALMARGRTNFEIAEAMGVSLEGAKYHVSEILAKLDVSSREEAVAVWQGRRRGLNGGLSRFAAGLANHSLAWKLAGGGAALAVAAVAVVAFAPFAKSGSEGEHLPSTPEEFLQRFEEEMSRDGKVLHLRSAAMLFDGSNEEPTWSHEAWFDFSRDRAHVAFTKDQTYEADVPDRLTQIVLGDVVYGFSNDSPTRYTADEAGVRCLRIAPAAVEQLACGLLSGTPPELHASVDTSAVYLGQAAIALVFTARSSMDGIPPTPGPDGNRPPPSPTFGPGTPQATETTCDVVSRFLVARDTYLPLAYTSQGCGPNTASGLLTRFAVELVDRAPAGAFDPEAMGYTAPEDEEMQALDNPMFGVPLYWLGREFDPGGGLPTLTLFEVDGNRYVPNERPSVMRLGYVAWPLGSADGRVSIEMWPPGAWELFQSRLGGGFPWAACSATEELQVNGATVRIRSARDNAPKSPAVNAQPITPGADPPPTSTPIPTMATCPTGLYDVYLAEVVYNDVTVTINPPVGLISVAGDLGAYDSPETLEALARGLRLRSKGE
ncbi:hypothetical protein AYO38_00010 [bacterium SCGC AG-212-C10]|nr:hypothetical protein AYO38_00010 [bacterium SCGC AG-212-C10]